MGSVVIALLVLLAQEEVIQRTDPARTQYLEAAGLCRTAEELIDQNPEGAAQKLTELLDKSVPEAFHEVILGISDRASTFFAAASDKSPDLKTAHQDLDGLLRRFAETLRNLK
jgi:hypothetical protein